MNAARLLNLDELNFQKSNGVVTVVTQDATTGAVLMVAGANREAMELTQSTGEMHYTSRTRGLWHKGATSGNVQHVVSLSPDCDGDAVLARVHPAGPACHTGQVSCFGETALGADAIGVLAATIASRADDTVAATAGEKPSYTQRLLSDRNLRLKKLGEGSGGIGHRLRGCRCRTWRRRRRRCRLSHARGAPRDWGFAE